MELRVLQYFLAVTREQSISGAAESLHLSQPTLSRQLKELEEELGRQLFIRGNRRITLTEEGMILTDICRRYHHRRRRDGRRPITGKSGTNDTERVSSGSFSYCKRRPGHRNGRNGSGTDRFRSFIWQNRSFKI